MTTTSIVLLTLLAQLSTPAPDALDKAKAKNLLSQGTTLYKHGEYAAALEKFEEAYATFPSPKLYFNIGQANRDLGRPVEALIAFAKFLDLAQDASVDTRADAQLWMTELQRKLGQIRIECPVDGAEISLDGKSVGISPLRDPLWATAGHHQITATHAVAAPAVQGVEVKAGVLETVQVRLVATAATAPVNAPMVTSLPVAASPVANPPVAAPPMAAVPSPAIVAPAESFVPPAAVALTGSPARPVERSGGWLLGRRWTWVAGGAAVLFAGTAGIVGGMAQSRFSDLKKSCGKDNPSRPGCSEGDISSLQTRMTTANVLWGMAGAAAVTAGVLFFIEGRPVAVAPLADRSKGLFAKVEF